MCGELHPKRHETLNALSLCKLQNAVPSEIGHDLCLFSAACLPCLRTSRTPAAIFSQRAPIAHAASCSLGLFRAVRT